jgi:hypothetical protein
VKKAYIILVHNKPDQLLLLLNALNDSESTFYIHIDVNSQIDFSQALKGFTGKYELTKREDGKWGGIGIVKATINGLSAISASGKQYDYISLISGQDYPIKSNEFINEQLASNPDRNYIEYFSLPYKGWTNGGIDRVTNYYIGKRRDISLMKNYLLAYANKVVEKTRLFQRHFPTDLQLFGGSQWWTINMDTAKYILSFLNERPEYLRFHKYSLLPDEMFFQTIVLNGDDKMKASVVNNNKRYIDWSKPKGPYPAILTMDDLPALMKSESLFARKFDMDVDVDVINKLNNILKGHNE